MTRPLGLPALACVLAGLCLTASCGRSVRELPQAVTQQIGIQEPNDREAMLNGQVLKPPREVKEREDERKRLAERQAQREKSQEEIGRLLASVAQEQNTLSQIQKELKASLEEQQKNLERLKAGQEEHASQKPWAEVVEHLGDLEKKIGTLAEEARKPQPVPPPPSQAPPPSDPGKANLPPSIELPPSDPALPPAVADANPEKVSGPASPPAAPGAERSGEAAEGSGEGEGRPVVEPPGGLGLGVSGDTASLAGWEEEPKAGPVKRIPVIFTPEAQAMRKEAEKIYREIIAKHPDSEALTDARMGLAQMALENARVPEALLQYEALIEDRPEDSATARARQLAGELRLEQGAYPEARKHFLGLADAFPLHPEVPRALWNAAFCQERMGKCEEALRDYELIRRRFSGTQMERQALTSKADLLARMGRFEQARAEYAELMKNLSPEAPDQAFGALGIARTWLLQRNAPEARKVLKEFLSKRVSLEHGGEATFLAGCSYAQEDRPLDAARVFAELPASFPNHSRSLQARLNAGQEFAKAELQEQALQQFSRLLEESKQASAEVRARLEPQALNGRLRALRKTGRFDEARAELARLHQDWPDHPLAQAADLEEAEILARQQRPDEAVKLLEAIALANKGSPLAIRALVRKAEIEEQRFLPAQAIDTYLRLNQASRSDQLNAANDLRRAVALLDLHQDEQALGVFRRMAGDPYVPFQQACVASYYIGVALERSGRIEEAVGAYEQFIRGYEKRSELKQDPELKELLASATWKLEKLKWLKGLTAVTQHGFIPRPVPPKSE